MSDHKLAKVATLMARIHRSRLKLGIQCAHKPCGVMVTHIALPAIPIVVRRLYNHFITNFHQVRMRNNWSLAIIGLRILFFG